MFTPPCALISKLRSSEPYDPYIPSGSQPPAGPSSGGNNAQNKKVGPERRVLLPWALGTPVLGERMGL